jgi:hypothetical protein
VHGEGYTLSGARQAAAAWWTRSPHCRRLPVMPANAKAPWRPPSIRLARSCARLPICWLRQCPALCGGARDQTAGRSHRIRSSRPDQVA